MTEGAGLRQSHFGSGYDAGKARLQAEVEQLRLDLQEARQIIAARDKEIERLIQVGLRLTAEKTYAENRAALGSTTARFCNCAAGRGGHLASCPRVER